MKFRVDKHDEQEQLTKHMGHINLISHGHAVIVRKASLVYLPLTVFIANSGAETLPRCLPKARRSPPPHHLRSRTSLQLSISYRSICRKHGKLKERLSKPYSTPSISEQLLIGNLELRLH